MNGTGPSWTANAMSAVGTVLVVAVVGRLAWELLSPLVAPLLGISVLCALALWIRRRRW